MPVQQSRLVGGARMVQESVEALSAPVQPGPKQVTMGDQECQGRAGSMIGQ